ncbi:MAG: DNA polymerase III subunit beta [Alphaproteobacteria bacterium]
MKIKTQKKILYKLFSRIQGIAEKNSIKPLTSNVLIIAENSFFSVSATDLLIGMKSTYKNIKIIKEGKISVNAKRIFEIIKEMPDEEITIFEKEKYNIEITCESDLKFNIFGLPPEDYPLFIKENTENFVEWKSENILNMIKLTSFSISTDIEKPSICGCYIKNIENEKIKIVTTDGYRLSILEDNFGGKLPIEEGIIIPHKAVLEISKILNEKKEEKKVCFFINKKNLMIKIGEIEFFSRLIEKKFPDYNVIVPGEVYNKIKIKLEKKRLRPILRRMSIISDENNSPVVFSFENKNLDIHTEDSNIGSLKENYKIKEEVKKIKFFINSNFLLDIINTVENDVFMEFNAEDEEKPIVVRPVDRENIKYIIMPMKIE